jgi:hypothetical protein
MSPFERKIVHDAVAAAGQRSESEGEEPNRRIVVYPLLSPLALLAPLASGRPQFPSSLLARRKLLARQSRRERALRLAGGRVLEDQSFGS